MKQLDLKTFNLEELTDCQCTNGGSIILTVALWALTCLAWDIISNPKETAEAWNEGFEMAFNE